MYSSPKSSKLRPPCLRQFRWLGAGVVLGALASINPFYRPELTLELAMAVWFADLILALILVAHPIAAQVGSLLIGVSLAVPCFLQGTPLSRGLLMCIMAFPLLVVAVPLLAPPTANYRERIAYLFTWLGAHVVKRRRHSFDLKGVVHFVLATSVLCAATVCVKAIPAAGVWLIARWLAGGIMILALAEMVTAGHDFLTALMGINAPALMRSPILSTSLSEFWTKRWNPAASLLVFRTFFFTPLARRGVAVALCAAFFASAVGHVMLPYMTIGKLDISLACGAFFLVQPLLIGIERSLNVRRWPQAAARTWTLIALAITSPLFVEPVLQIVEASWDPKDGVLAPTIVVVGFVMGVNLFFAVGSLSAVNGFRPREGVLIRDSASSSRDG